MESCYGGMSTRLKQRAVIEFLSAENVTPAEIHRPLQAVYGENTVNRTTVNLWAIKFRECEPGRTNIVHQPRSGWPVSVTDDKHQIHDRIFGSWEHCQFSSSARYSETIKNLRWRVCRVRRSTSRNLLLHDNARPHTARATIDALETLKFEVLSHPPYSPDLAPSDFHFIPRLERDLKGTRRLCGKISMSICS